MHVVTGASDGIGQAVAAALAGRGADVVAVARTGDRLERLAAEFPTVTVVATDLSTREGRESLHAACADLGDVTSLVHGAASRVDVVPFDGIDPEALIEDMRIHVAAVIALTQHFSKVHSVGRVVVFDSYSASTPRVGWAGYSVVKAAAHMVARSASAELAGPAVLRLYPGAVRTPLLEAMLQSAPSPAREAYRRMESEGRVAEAGEIGEWVADVLLGADDGRSVIHYDEVRRKPPDRAAGGCLCGGVRYRITGPMRDVIDCHCERCRRTSGHHLAATRARIEDIHLVAAETLRWFSPYDDPAVRYGFCRTCGASLFWQAEGLDTWSVSAGTLDSPTGLRTVAAWFVAEASDYVTLDPTVPGHPGEPGAVG